MFKKMSEEKPLQDSMCIFRKSGIHPWYEKDYIPMIGYFSKYEKSPSGWMVTLHKWPIHWFIDKSSYTICPFEAELEWMYLPE